MKQIISINGKQYLDLNRDIRENEDLDKKSQRLFREAIKAANNGKTDEAMDLGKEALVYARYVKSPQRVFIHNFLAVLHLEKKKFAVARYHTWQALNDLEGEATTVQKERAYLSTLQKEIANQEKAYKQIEPIRLAS
jgi:hypothetical protein